MLFDCLKRAGVTASLYLNLNRKMKNYNYSPTLFQFLQKKEKEINISDLSEQQTNQISYFDFISSSKKEQQAILKNIIRNETNR